MQYRKLIDYLPPFMGDIAEIKVILDIAEQPEIIKLCQSLDDGFKDQFIMDATENGVERWEKILKIIPKATFTLDERKFTILARINEKLPFTIRTLQDSLKTLCGEGGYNVQFISDDYSLIVKLALTAKNNFVDVVHLLDRVVPVNMVTDVQIMYNSNEKLSKFTHEQLKRYTHYDLRNEVLRIGNKNKEF